MTLQRLLKAILMRTWEGKRSVMEEASHLRDYLGCHKQNVVET